MWRSRGKEGATSEGKGRSRNSKLVEEKEKKRREMNGERDQRSFCLVSYDGRMTKADKCN